MSPLYEYRCPTCKVTVELVQSHDAPPALTICDCGEEAPRVISQTGPWKLLILLLALASPAIAGEKKPISSASATVGVHVTILRLVPPPTPAEIAKANPIPAVSVPGTTISREGWTIHVAFD